MRIVITLLIITWKSYFFYVYALNAHSYMANACAPYYILDFSLSSHVNRVFTFGNTHTSFDAKSRNVKISLFAR